MRDPLVTTADHTSRRDAGDAGAGDGRVWRYDSGELLSPHLTPEGFVFCQGRAGRPCVLVYRRGDGTVVRELIPAEELHREASLATLAGKTLTLEHPPEDVDVVADNVAEYGVGDLGRRVWVGEGGYVEVDITIRRVDGVRAWQTGVNDLSMGYKCRIDATPGVHPTFGPYDAVQRDRVYNHLALTGRARAEAGMGIRRDSAVQITDHEATMKPKLIALLTLLGVKRFDAEDPALEEAATKVAEMQAAISEATPTATVADLRAKIAALEAELAAKKATLTAIEAASASAPSVPEEVDAAMEADPVNVTDAAATAGMAPGDLELAKKQDGIRKAVRKAAGERARLDGLAVRYRLDSVAVGRMGTRSLRRAVVQAANPATRQDASDEYCRAAVDMLDQGSRRDGGATDPYAGLGADFEANTEAERRAGRETADPARRDAEDTNVDPMAAVLKQRFEARHGVGARN